ncbi:DUF2939 domain-containing protein [Sphingomicrobium lutaoense]|uniref:DUF2939 domain-containing protein n=1 Tax=Sphingomicrobium lutaoense TaxID=515949 RepID=A0A839YYG4_9SPHN|nr:DUF2939 domain-containing protein [Sphingomicrobium lutaoense]MBB3763358.1 hypothetical protein [Sphingomicrobium lutaoense]
MRKLIALLLVIAIAVGGWWYASPLMTLKSMRDAGLAGDAEAVSAHIDYPALREDMKKEMSLLIARQAQTDPGPLGEAGTAFAQSIISPMVDRLITPESMAEMFDATRQAQGAPLPALGGEKELEIDRQSLNRFTARAEGEEAGLEFARDGLSWKLVGVDVGEGSSL